MNLLRVPWSQNSKADEVARYASLEDRTNLPNLKLEIQKFPNIEELYKFSIQGNASWTNPILSYLKHGQLPLDQTREEKLCNKLTDSHS